MVMPMMGRFVRRLPPYDLMKIDEFVRSRKTLFLVIPAQAGIQSFQGLLNSRLRGSDDLKDFLRIHQN